MKQLIASLSAALFAAATFAQGAAPAVTPTTTAPAAQAPAKAASKSTPAHATAKTTTGDAKPANATPGVPSVEARDRKVSEQHASWEKSRAESHAKKQKQKAAKAAQAKGHADNSGGRCRRAGREVGRTGCDGPI